VLNIEFALLFTSYIVILIIDYLLLMNNFSQILRSGMSIYYFVFLEEYY